MTPPRTLYTPSGIFAIDPHLGQLDEKFCMWMLVESSITKPEPKTRPQPVQNAGILGKGGSTKG